MPCGICWTYIEEPMESRDTPMSTRQLARELVNCDVDLLESATFASGVLERWQTTKGMPPAVVSIFCHNDGSISIPDRGTPEFVATLEAIHPRIDDVQGYIDVFNKLSLKRLARLELPSYAKHLKPHWTEPKHAEEGLLFIVENLRDGTIERFRVGEDGRVTIEVIGKGVQLDLL